MRLWHQINRYCCIFATIFPRGLCAVLFIWSAWVASFKVPYSFFSETFFGPIITLTGTLLAGLALYMYYLVIKLGPGSPLEFEELRIPDYSPEMRDCINPPEWLNSVMVKNNGKIRFCTKCRAWKPDRCHHCSACRRCVLRMDHHCPWFSTCIGFKNHRFFIQFLNTTVVYCLFVWAVTFTVLYDFCVRNRYLTEYFSLNYLFACILGFINFFAVGAFAAYSCWQVFTNQTTIESYDYNRYRSNLYQKNDPHYKYSNRPNSETLGNVFDLGYGKNWRSIMGETPYQWFLPIRKGHRPVDDEESLLQDKAYVQLGLNYDFNQDLYLKLQENSRIQQQLYEELMRYRERQKQDQRGAEAL